MVKRSRDVKGLETTLLGLVRPVGVRLTNFQELVSEGVITREDRVPSQPLQGTGVSRVRIGVSCPSLLQGEGTGVDICIRVPPPIKPIKVLTMVTTSSWSYRGLGTVLGVEHFTYSSLIREAEDRLKASVVLTIFFGTVHLPKGRTLLVKAQD